MENSEPRYVDYYSSHKEQSDPTVLSTLAKADYQMAQQMPSSLLVVLNHLKEANFLPLTGVLDTICSSNYDTIHIINNSPCVIDEHQVLSLMRAADHKLHTVSLQDLSFTKNFLRDLFQSGFPCRVLKLTSSSLQKLDMVGNFMQLRKLNLDFCTSLTTIQKDCFSQVPNLMHLSMCGTSISYLWTTTAALSKLHLLTELRFQNCLCCEDTGVCPVNSSDKSGYHVNKTRYHNEGHFATGQLLTGSNCQLQRLSLLELLSDSAHPTDGLFSMIKNKPCHQKTVQDSKHTTYSKDPCQDLKLATPRKKYISHHPSPVCFEKHYREFMIASLPRLVVLDNLPITGIDRKVAEVMYSQNFEYLPYKRQPDESIPRILHDREIASCAAPRRSAFKSNRSSLYRKSKNSYSRSLCAAKLGASPWPLLHPISNISCIKNDDSRIFRPRQFEYHPSDSSLMAFGTLDGEVVVINHESRKHIAYMPTFGSSNSILGLCWLMKYPSKVLGGSDNGSLRLYDINDTSSKGTDSHGSSNNFINFEKFDQLTSVHVNSSDELFLVNGCTRNVAIYDMSTGKRLQLFSNLHREPINVAKFAHHSPCMFATSSFDHDVKMWDLRTRMIQPCYSATSSRGNVMVCFSPDDHYLLVSAVDNEVKQLLAVDGRLHTDFGIASSGSSHNYTRSYYMNDGDYIISGSSEEHVVRICCTQTGRRLRDVYFEGRASKKSMFVQSLRSDPFREFNMSILASYGQSNSKCEIIKVNLLASNEDAEDNSYVQQVCPSFSLGG